MPRSRRPPAPGVPRRMEPVAGQTNLPAKTAPLAIAAPRAAGAAPHRATVASGCQPKFGVCVDPGNVTSDGFCGVSGSNKTCSGSTFGDCCSSSGHCGSSADHCGTGCQASFGTCSGASNVTTDGHCGVQNGKVCKGSSFGGCCSSRVASVATRQNIAVQAVS